MAVGQFAKDAQFGKTLTIYLMFLLIKMKVHVSYHWNALYKVTGNFAAGVPVHWMQLTSLLVTLVVQMYLKMYVKQGCIYPITKCY
jgi:hypothetical protein